VYFLPRFCPSRLGFYLQLGFYGRPLPGFWTSATSAGRKAWISHEGISRSLFLSHASQQCRGGQNRAQRRPRQGTDRGPRSATGPAQGLRCRAEVVLGGWAVERDDWGRGMRPLRHRLFFSIEIGGFLG